MKSSNFSFIDEYSVKIFVYKWEPDGTKPKAAIMILHGLVEHGGRYKEFAHALTDNGYICYAADHRGHGKTAGDVSNLGQIGPGGADGLTQDIKQLWDIMRNEYPNIPIFVYGHSFGSIMLQVFMQKYGSELKGAILSATTGKQDMFLLVKFIVKREIKRIGYNEPSHKMDDIILSVNNRQFKKTAKTKFDWLSRDEEEVKNYINDPYCGFVLPASFYLEVLFNADYPWSKENEIKIPKNLPIFFIVGERDSLSKNTKKVKSLMKRYVKNGLTDITYKSYPGARHDLIKELKETKEQVFKDVIAWLNSQL